MRRPTLLVSVALVLTSCGGSRHLASPPAAPARDQAAPTTPTATETPVGFDAAQLASATVERCTMTGPALTLGTESLHMASGPDGGFFVLDQAGDVRRYVVDAQGPCVLHHDATFGTAGTLHGAALARGASSIATDAAGHLYLGGASEVVRISNGIVDARCDVDGTVAVTVAPGGQMGLVTSFLSEAAKRLRFGESECTTSEWAPEPPLARGDVLSFVSDDRITVGNSGLRVVDAAGRTTATMRAPASPDGYVTSLSAQAIVCGAGVCVVDAQRMAVVGYSADGHELGAVSFREGLRVPLTWMIGAALAAGPSVVVSLLEQDDPQVSAYTAGFMRITPAPR